MTHFLQNNEIGDLCEGVYRVDLGESFLTNIYLQNFAKFGFGERANKLGRLHHLVVDFSLKF